MLDALLFGELVELLEAHCHKLFILVRVLYRILHKYHRVLRFVIVTDFATFVAVTTEIKVPADEALVAAPCEVAILANIARYTGMTICP